jgi:hypothetical protein
MKEHVSRVGKRTTFGPWTDDEPTGFIGAVYVVGHVMIEKRPDTNTHKAVEV